MSGINIWKEAMVATAFNQAHYITQYLAIALAKYFQEYIINFLWLFHLYINILLTRNARVHLICVMLVNRHIPGVKVNNFM
jgi:hypothetical protein